MLTGEETEKYLQAGRLAAKIREEMLKKIRVGERLLDIAEEIERKIIDGGAKPAFPVNICVNEAAAHYTPQINDARVVGAGDLVKIDLGAHIDGYIADLAFTWCSEKSRLIDVSGKALDAGISMMRPGIKISEVSLAINKVIAHSGFGPVVNLTGHSLGRYVFHGGTSIPNVPTGSSYVLKEDDVFALEPFVCESPCHVEDSEPVEIFQFINRKPVRSMEARKILDLAENEFHGLPFAKRWLVRHISPIRIKLALIELEKVGAIMTYPILKDMGGRKIAQSEHTVIVAEKPVVTTK